MSQETLALDSAIQGNAAMYGIFNDLSSYVEVDDNGLFSFGDAGFDNPFSLSVWIYLTGYSFANMIAAKGGEYSWRTGTNGRPLFTVWDRNDSEDPHIVHVEGAGNIPLNKWTHLAVTYNGNGSSSGIIHYINGVLLDWYDTENTIRYDNMVNDELPFRIGRGVVWGADSYFSGHLHDFRLYNKELSQAEITAIYGGSPLSTNIVAEYKLRGDCQDNSGNNLHGTNYNVTFPEEVSTLALHSPVETQVSLGSTVQGNAGLYGIFNGTSSYVEVDDNDLFSFGDGSNDSPFSICAWVYINDNASFPLIAKYGGTVALREYALITGPDGEIQMILYDKSIPKYILAKSSTIFVENAWTHVAATYNGDGNSYADIGLYVNGSPIVTLDGDSGGYVAMENSSTSLWIGHYINTAFGNGKIRGVRIYNKELSAVEVLAEYNTGQVVDSDALIAEYKLRGDCQDSGPNDLHGTNNDVTFPEAVDPLALNSSLL